MLRIFVLVVVASGWLVPTSAQEEGVKLVHTLGDRVSDRTYTTATKSFSLTIPEFTGATEIRIVERESRPGITSDVQFIGNNGMVACIVSTKIRADYPKDDSLLDRPKKNYLVMQEQIGEDFVLIDSADSPKDTTQETETTRPSSRFLQFTVKNERYDKTVFPFGLAMHRDDKLKSMSIHRLFVRDGYLIEAVILTPAAPEDTVTEIQSRVEDRMSTMLKSMTSD